MTSQSVSADGDKSDDEEINQHLVNSINMNIQRRLQGDVNISHFQTSKTMVETVKKGGSIELQK